MSEATTEGEVSAARATSSPPASSSSPAAGGWEAQPPEESPEPRRRVAAAGERETQTGGALHLACRLEAPETGKEMKEVEECIEELLARLDEFCGMTDMIRSDTSQLLGEAIPLIKAKVVEMNNVYTKVDKLEAFVKMAGYHLSFLEQQLLQAEKAHTSVPSSVQKLLGSVTFPLFKKTCTPVVQQNYNLPELYRTEDYFPIKFIASKYQNH